MKYVISEMQMNKIAFAALLLGAFTLSPFAKAADEAPPADQSPQFAEATQRGLSMSQLKALGVTIEKGTNNAIVFKGAMPEACAKSLQASTVVDYVDGKHVLTIDMPACRNGRPNPPGKMVIVGSAIQPHNFTDQDGKFYLRRFMSGDEADPTDDALTGRDGKQIEHTSMATVATAREKTEREKAEKEAKEARELARKDRLAQEGDFIRMVTEQCQAGNFQYIIDELEKQSRWFGDITKIISELGKAKEKALDAKMKAAKTPEELKEAYDALIASGTVDQEKALESYLTKRTSMFEGKINDKGVAVSAQQSEIDSYFADVSDAGEDKKAKQAVVWAHTQLGNRLRDDKDYNGAESQYEKALRHADIDAKLNIEKEMAKMFLEAAEACLAENKTKPAKCDALAKKARKHMDSAIAAAGRKRGDDALEELNGMKMEKIQTFGVDGINVKVSGYGNFNPYGGMYDQRKRQIYQTGMQEEYMKRMMQMQMGVGFQGAGTGSGTSFFR